MNQNSDHPTTSSDNGNGSGSNADNANTENGSSDDQHSQARHTRPSRTIQPPTRRRRSPNNDDSHQDDTDVITMIQQNDQELAAAKLKAKSGSAIPSQQQQQDQQHGQPSVPVTAAKRSSQHNQSQQERRRSQATRQPEPPNNNDNVENDAAMPSSKPAARAVSTNHTNTPTTPRLPHQGSRRSLANLQRPRAQQPNQQAATQNNGSPPARQANSNNKNDKNSNGSTSTEPSKNDVAAKEMASSGRRRRHVNTHREQAPTTAFQSSQLGSSEFLREVILERANLEETTSSSGIQLPTSSSTLEENKEEEPAPQRENWSPQHNNQASDKSRGSTPVPITEQSMPGAFSMGTSFHPNSHAGPTDNSSVDVSCSDPDDDDDDDDDDSQREEYERNNEDADVGNHDTNQSDGTVGESRIEVAEQGHGNSHQNDVLVEATLVEAMDDSIVNDPVIPALIPELELVTAEKMPDPYRDMLKSKSGRRWILGGGCIVLIIIIIVGVILGVVVGGRQPDQPLGSDAPTPSPTLFEDLLPAYTQEAIQIASTPQAKAYQWYLDDLEYQANTTQLNSQLKTSIPFQRFLLATFYFSTGGGTSWKTASDWLQHDESECAWFSQFYGSFCSTGPQTRRQLGGTNVRRHVQSTVVPSKLYYNRLSLFQNNLTGSIPPELSLLSFLDVFDPHTNSIGGTIPSELGMLEYITLFQVASNRLTGTVPTELGLLPRLKQLNLAFNLLTGSIPSELGQLSKSATMISISNNQMSGSLPSEIGLLTKCTELYFYKNKNLTGPLPTELGQMKALAKLELNDTNLTGFLPSELGSLTKLKTIRLSCNRHLSGTLPDTWGNLAMLETLELHNTNVTGKVPSLLCSLMANGTLNPIAIDCDKVDCSPCRMVSCDCRPSMENVSDGGELINVDLPPSNMPNDTNVSSPIEVTTSPEIVELPISVGTETNPPLDNSTVTNSNSTSATSTSAVENDDSSTSPELEELPGDMSSTPPPLDSNAGTYNSTILPIENHTLSSGVDYANVTTPPLVLIETSNPDYQVVVTAPPELVEIPGGYFSTPPPLDYYDDPTSLPIDNYGEGTQLDSNVTLGLVEPSSPEYQGVVTAPPELVEIPGGVTFTPPPLDYYDDSTSLPIDNYEEGTQLDSNLTLPPGSTSPPMSGSEGFELIDVPEVEEYNEGEETFVSEPPFTAPPLPEVVILPIGLNSTASTLDNFTLTNNSSNLPVENKGSLSRQKEATFLNSNLTVLSDSLDLIEAPERSSQGLLATEGSADYQGDSIVTSAPTESLFSRSGTNPSKYASANIFDHSTR